MNQQDKTWCPAIELNEINDNLVLKAEVPGVEIEHLSIHAETDSVAIAGVRDCHNSTAEKELIPSQLHYGQLLCKVPLPAKIEVDRVKAELIDGVLHITMPKAKVISTVNG